MTNRLTNKTTATENVHNISRIFLRLLVTVTVTTLTATKRLIIPLRRSLHDNGGLRRILIDGKTDETKNPMLILKECGQKGLAQLSYANDAYPEYYRLHKRMGKKQNYFNYLHLFVQKNYKNLLNMFERCYIDVIVYAIIILCGKSSLIEPKIISTPSYIHTSL